MRPRSRAQGRPRSTRPRRSARCSRRARHSGSAGSDRPSRATGTAGRPGREGRQRGKRRSGSCRSRRRWRSRGPRWACRSPGCQGRAGNRQRSRCPSRRPGELRPDRNAGVRFLPRGWGVRRTEMRVIAHSRTVYAKVIFQIAVPAWPMLRGRAPHAVKLFAAASREAAVGLCIRAAAHAIRS